MTAEQITAFVVFTVVASSTPGPSNIMLTAIGANVGIVRGLPGLFGATVGMGAMIFIVAVGFGQLVVGNAEVLRVLNWLGMAVLLWLAWKIATAGRAEPAAADDPSAEQRRPLGFFAVAAFQWVNPKSWIVSASAAATYLTAAAGDAVLQAAALGLLFLIAATPGCFVWLAFGAGVQRLLRTERATRIFNIAMGALLAASVLLFVL